MATATDNHPRPLPPLSPEDEARFWSKVRKGRPGQCWEWTAATINGRGGVFKVMDGPLSPRLVRAARVAYLLHHRKDPGAKRVCHTCTSERCCNPAHLYLGRPPVSAAWTTSQAKLDPAKVMEIRRLAAAGVGWKELCRRYRVKRCAIDNVVARRTWKEVR